MVIKNIHIAPLTFFTNEGRSSRESKWKKSLLDKKSIQPSRWIILSVNMSDNTCQIIYGHFLGFQVDGLVTFYFWTCYICHITFFLLETIFFSLDQDQSFGMQVSSSVVKQATGQLSFTGQCWQVEWFYMKRKTRVQHSKSQLSNGHLW